MLSDKFIERYKTIKPPFGGNGLGEFVYLRTYARWIETEKRREEWYETVRRVVDYSIGLYKDDLDHNKEAEELFDQIFNLKLFPAGRTLWVGGTKAAEKFPMANYNCSFRVIDDLDAFGEIFYLLMLGCGTGFRILPEDVAKLPIFYPGIELELVSEPDYAASSYGITKLETTSIQYDIENNNWARITVGDSKEGWVDALRIYLKLMALGEYERIIINTFYIRPKGAILKTFGGRASGPEGLMQMFLDIHNVITADAFINEYEAKLEPINALDIANIIAWNVVVGGVRRSSQIALFGQNDKAVLNAKVGLYTKGSPNYGKNWRAMSNNSIYFTEKPDREQMVDIFERIQHNGEPGFVNAQSASLRRPNFNGINPCAEILLDNRGLCNLCEINVTAFVIESTNGFKLDFEALEKTINLATLMGLRIANLDLELPEWDKIQKRDRLIGISLSGIVDAEDKMGHRIDLESLRSWANYYARINAKKMRIPEPLLVTTVKPSGTVSQLPTISSGVHRSYGPNFVRRVRVTATDPIAKVMRDLGYPTFPDTAMTPYNAEDFAKLNWYEQGEVLKDASTWVIEFPVKTSAIKKATDESAIEQFNRYLRLQREYTDHNTSITIYFKENEVDVLIDMILDNWDDYIAISLLPTDGQVYELAPYESIDENEYLSRSKYLEPERIKEALNLIETSELLDADLDPSCATGICPPR